MMLPSIQPTVSRFKYAINNSIDGIMGSANGLLCLTSGIFGILSNPAAVLKGLTNIAIGLAASIVAAATKIISDRVNEMIGSILSPVKLVRAFIIQLTADLISIQDLIKTIKDKSMGLDAYFKERQNCAAQAANLMNCLTQNIVNKITNKVAMKIDQKGMAKLAKSVQKDMVDPANGAIVKQINRYGKFVDKVNNQSKFLV